MTTPAKLYGKDLSVYDDVDVDQLLSQLSPEEINMLAKEVDPDDSFLPPDQRNSYECSKDPTGPLNRKKLIEHINKQALETPDRPELKPFVAGIIRGKKWMPPPESVKMKEAEEQIAIDLGDEYEHALADASQEEIIDLAAILGFHSMMNQDQYHASLLNKGQPIGLGWDGITKASKPKIFPQDPPNNTDPEQCIKQVREDDQKFIDLNWNNIKNISDEKFDNLFDALLKNTHLEVLSLTNVGLTDRHAAILASALEKNNTLRVVNVETNFISPHLVVRLVQALLKTKTVEEFRASNQRSSVLGNKIEMEITQLVEQNPTLVRLGLHLEYNDARHRIASHLQKNIDRNLRTKRHVNASFNIKLPRASLANNAVITEAMLQNGDVPSEQLITPPNAGESDGTTPTTEVPPQPIIPQEADTKPVEEIVQPTDTTQIPVEQTETPQAPVEQTETSQAPVEQTEIPQPPIEQAEETKPAEVKAEEEIKEVVEHKEESAESANVENNVEPFVKASPVDWNPNPHSTERSNTTASVQVL